MPATACAINKYLDYDFGNEEYTPPAKYYLGLCSGALGTDGVITSGCEPSDANYQRIEITNNKSFWGPAQSGSVVNITSASFPTASSEAWGYFRSVFLADGDINTGGSVIWYYDILNPTVLIGANTEIFFEEGTIIAKRI